MWYSLRDGQQQLPASFLLRETTSIHSVPTKKAGKLSVLNAFFGLMINAFYAFIRTQPHYKWKRIIQISKCAHWPGIQRQEKEELMESGWEGQREETFPVDKRKGEVLSGIYLLVEE